MNRRSGRIADTTVHKKMRGLKKGECPCSHPSPQTDRVQSFGVCFFQDLGNKVLLATEARFGY